MKRLVLTTFIILLSGQISVKAQQTVLAAGQSVSGNGSVSYSIGQVVYTVNSASTISVTQGVQQTYGSPLIAGLNEANPFQVNIYPNPTAEWLILEFLESQQNCSYQLLDENGKLLQNAGITETKTEIQMSGFASGTYFLKILNNTTEIQTAKIVKSNQP